MANTVEQRRISHELVEAWQEVEQTLRDECEAPSEFEHDHVSRMYAAMDAIIAAFTPGYNAESEPEAPEESDANGKPTADALTAMEYVEVSTGVWVPQDLLDKVVRR